MSNTLDPQTFYDALETKTAVSKFKMAVGATSIVEPEFEDDLWMETKPWSVNIDINNLENMVDQEIGAVSTRAKGVTPERLSKIWSIDLETAKRTIGLTSEHIKHVGSDHLGRRYPTNDRMLRYKHWYRAKALTSEYSLIMRINS